MKYIIAVLLIMGLNSNSFASPTYMAGVSFTFGGDFGLTLKALTDDKKSRAVGSIGATYYPFAAKTFGFDLGAGYTYSDAAAIVSWDFIQNSVQFSAGYADIDDKKKRYYAPPPVTAPPANNNNLN